MLKLHNVSTRQQTTSSSSNVTYTQRHRVVPGFGKEEIELEIRGFLGNLNRSR